MKTTSPYKTAEELGIEQWEHDGLVALIGRLSRSELDFNMFKWDCGTCHCIGGHVEALAGRDILESSSHFNRALYELYHPGAHALDCVQHSAWQATQPQAARAIVNFLTLGDPKWDDVMREPA